MRVFLENEFEFLGPPLADGGESEGIYEYPKDPDNYLIKIYRDGEGDPEKLRYQCKHPPKCFDPKRPNFSWPLKEVLDGSKKKVIGCLVPRIRNAVSLAEIANSDVRYSFLFRVGANLAKRIGELHAEGIVVGDIQPENVLVLRSGDVVLIDMDSVQLRGPNGALYPCNVGLPEFQPPEFQGIETYRGLKRTRATDRWGGAVIFFGLLIGQHPFHSHYTGDDDPAPDVTDLVREKIWPWAKTHPDHSPPRGAEDLMALPNEVINLFYTTFEDGGADPKSRPSMEEWTNQLSQFGTGRWCPSRRAWRKISSEEQQKYDFGWIWKFLWPWPVPAASFYWRQLITAWSWYLAPRFVWLFVFSVLCWSAYFAVRDARYPGPPLGVGQANLMPLPFSHPEIPVSVSLPIPKPEPDPFYCETLADLRGLDEAGIWDELRKD